MNTSIKKVVHVHLGPHKTGSSAVQSEFGLQQAYLQNKLGLRFVHGKRVLNAAKALNKGDVLQASNLLSACVETDKKSETNVILSCEDFAGDLPGRTAQKHPYPSVYENATEIAAALKDCECRFYFFLRDPAAWLQSAYVQNLKHRQKFTSFEQFSSFLKVEDLWSKVINEAVSKFGKNFKIIPYSEDRGFSAPAALLAEIDPNAKLDARPGQSERRNVSPSTDVVPALEAVNRSGASNFAKRNAKARVLERDDNKDSSLIDFKFPRWSSEPPTRPDWLNPELGALWDRVENRVTRQDQSNLLPKISADLRIFRSKIVDAPDVFPGGGRSMMENQSRILKYRFRGQPETGYLLGLSISYLRRDTDHTQHAALLFQRLWREEYDILLGTVPTRWLISSFQTFMDHGVNEAQRTIGAGAYFYSNILKAYETERSLDGLPADSIYPNVAPSTPGKFPGLDRFKLGGSDLLLNTNACLLEIASKDACAGRIVQEFLVRMKKAHSIFSRMDASRIHHDANDPQFDNSWSFFEKPKKS